MRVLIVILAVSMLIGARRELWCVVIRCPGWKAQLSTFAMTVMMMGAAVISVVNVFPDIGMSISRQFRLAVVDVGLGLFLVGTLTGIYRRALRCGHDLARAALLSGLALIVPFAGLVTLLALRGAHG